MKYKDYYKLLELETSRVSLDDIKLAYRTVAKKYHPDVNVGDTLKVCGRTVNHQEYGEQFKVENFEKTENIISKPLLMISLSVETAKIWKYMTATLIFNQNCRLIINIQKR